MKNSILIDFEGKELEFFYGLSFLGEFMSSESMDIQEVVNSITEDPYVFIPKLMYKSYLHNCTRKDVTPVIKKQFELTDLIEQTGHFVDGSKASEFCVAFIKSIIDSLPKGEQEDSGEVKKK